MGEINIKGPIIDDADQRIYDWFGIPATSPMKVNNELLKMKDGEELSVYINSGGGSVFAGSEIFSALKEYKGNTVGKIVGLAASAASVVAMGVKKLEIAPTAQIMIHRASTYVGGNKDDLQHTADLLDGIDKSIANAYQTKTGIDSNELLDMMTKETWLTAQKAKELGFADAVMFENEEKFLNGTEGSGVLPQSVIDRVRNELTNNKPQNPELEPGLDPTPKPADKDDIEAIKMAIAKAKLKMIMAI